MERIIYTAIKNRKITIVLVIFAILFGIYTYYFIPKQESPDLNAPFAVITTIYPGASPEDVEELITSKIEEEVVGIDGFSNSNSQSKNSLSIVVLQLEHDTDVDKAWDDLREKMDALESELPEGIQGIEVNTDVAQTAGMIISISGSNYSYEELASYAEKFKKELSKIDGVSRFEITGKQEKEIVIKVDGEKLNFYQLSLEDIAQLIHAQNIEIPSGTMENEDGKINVKTEGTFESIKEIENVIVGVSEDTGAVLRLKDIADVQFQMKDSNYKIKQNGNNAVLLTGYFKENKNIVLIGKEVAAKINEMKAKLPKDISFDQVLYQPKTVSKAVNNFIVNLIEGVLFVIIVVLIGMGIRNAVIVSTAIPLSIMMTFSVMQVFGIKIHQISISALIIALGMLVDNAIVVSDAIQVRLDRDEEKMKACVEGVKEVAAPVFSSTLTTIGAFIPLLMLPSMAGEFIISIPQIVILSLFSSYIVALLVTPTMAYIFFKKSKQVQKQYRIRKFFDLLLEVGMRRKGIAILLILAVLGGAASLTMKLGLQFFPKADTNMLYIDIRSEKSSDLAKTEELTDEVSQILEEQPEIIGYTAAIGDGLPKFYYSMVPPVQSKDYGQIMIKVDLEKGNRFNSNGEMADALQEIFDESLTMGTATVKLLEQGEPIGSPVRIRVAGEDIERLQEVAEQIEDILKGIPGTMNMEDDFSDSEYQFYVDVDTDTASYYGVTKYDVQKEVSLALRGMDASTFIQDGNEYAIRVTSNIDEEEELSNFGIKSSITENKILLKQIGAVKLKAENPNIRKYDGERCIIVYSDIKTGYSSVEVQEQVEEKLKEMDLDDIDIVFDGERESIQENFGDIGTSAILAIMVIYLILLIQFNSFLQPLIILLTIPISAVGSIVGLYVFNQQLSFTALLGIVSLVGIVVNNAIVLIDFMNTERRSGKSIQEACMDAVDQRFRPIMLSTITTIIGLTPLAFSNSQLFTPMAIALMAGLIVSTLLTLVIIPIIYSMVESPIQYMKQKVKGSKKDHMEI